MMLPTIEDPPDIADRLPQYTARLESNAPVFMAGAYNGPDPEQYFRDFRALSIRGAFRYWLRALIGAAVTNDVAALQRAESELMGNTRVGSPLTVRMRFMATQSELGRHGLLVHNPKKTFDNPCYLRARFDLSLLSRPGTAIHMDDALVALSLLVRLGGVGKRSRRGFGSLRFSEPIRDVANVPVENIPTDPPDADNMPVVNIPTDPPTDGPDLAHSIEQFLKDAFVYARSRWPVMPLPGLPEYPILHEDHCKVAVITTPFADDPPATANRIDGYIKAMRAFWSLLRDDTKPTPARHFRDASVFGNAGANARLASPVRLHIARDVNGSSYMVVTAFRTTLPAGGDWPLVQEFLDTLVATYGGRIVFGGGAAW
ncbi:MAG: type III-B CRISPR module RAMP protein Cmr1 [Anaerolineae bacterium]|nr:type III-B CRISPR module RAMP protein Cmr1 [Anaerolineae bacterium]